MLYVFFFFSSRRRHTRFDCDWSSDVCSSDLPSEIENQLKFSPYIADAVVVGDGRKFLSCLVMIDHETVAHYAQERNVPFTNFASLCRATEIRDLIWSEIERVNRQLARVETIRSEERRVGKECRSRWS